MVRGTEVEEVQTKLLEISKAIQEASVGYLQLEDILVPSVALLSLLSKFLSNPR